MNEIIPKPVLVQALDGFFTLTAETGIYVNPGSAEMVALGQYLSGRVSPATGFSFPVLVTNNPPIQGHIYLTQWEIAHLGQEGYELMVTEESLNVTANDPAGIMHAIQTIRQLLPAQIEHNTPQPGPWTIPAGVISDYPTYTWRGMMLDVARHFFTVNDVKRLIDQMAYYKLNRLHLHLTDDQGWRLEIQRWPRLAIYGGSTETGGGPGGYYSQSDYADIVAYAHHHHIIVIPEVDLPGHTNAALASYAELNATGVAPERYTGVQVGFSSLDANKELTYTFLNEVLGEIAAITPGPYLHIGGDEAASTPPADYKKFIERVQAIVQAHGKQLIGWEEIGQTNLQAGVIAQHWHNNQMALQAAGQGAKIILSPATRTYLDIKYDAATVLGQNWAGYVNERDSYDWQPNEHIPGLAQEQILGLEAALWTESIETTADMDVMIFPRLIGLAELAWSDPAGHNWDDYKSRLANQAPRLQAMGINFYRSPIVPWPEND